MKKILLFCFFIVSTLTYAQSSQVRVTLKNDVVVIGELVEFDPLDHVTFKVAGKETTVLMTNVKSVEAAKKETTVSAEANNAFTSGQVGYYEITDKKDYPESYSFDIEGQTIKMILVRGGSFNMGYDGNGSLSMKSEPVHQVNISSYYISEQCIKEETAYKLLEKEKSSYKDKYYINRWKSANQIVEKIAGATQKPYRLLTEAEWEYASLMPNADSVLGSEKELEWCSDFYDKYSPGIQTNPQGPLSGKSHVYRSYRVGKNKWDRKPGHPTTQTIEACIRIAISADSIK